MKIAIIGAGAAGLSAGYELSKKGHQVELFERAGALGGLAGCFVMDGAFVEKFYHFICLHDSTYIQVLKELRLSHLLRWKYTDMGQYYAGQLHSFGRPLDLLRFHHLPYRDKIRFAMNIFKIKAANWEDWAKIENVPVNEWLQETFGPNVYRILHEPLIRLKFGKYAEKLSAAWMWARIHRVGKSRTRIRQREKVGYVEGGSQTIMDALGAQIISRGGNIRLKSDVQSLLLENGAVRGLLADGVEYKFDKVVSTVPLPAFLRLIPDTLRDKYWNALRSIESIGVVCVLLRTSRSFSPFFWTNINDDNIRLAGIIEYTNLNPLPHLKGDSIIYLPQYMASDDERFRKSNEEVLQQHVDYLQQINSEFRKEWIKQSFVFREKHAQPICEVGFTSSIPSINTPVKGLYLTDSSQLHPDDRTISNSLGLGQKAAAIASASD